jgi:hypothetical protein
LICCTLLPKLLLRRARRAALQPALAVAGLHCTGLQTGASASCRTGPAARSHPPTPAAEQQQQQQAAVAAAEKMIVVFALLANLLSAGNSSLCKTRLIHLSYKKLLATPL